MKEIKRIIKKEKSFLLLVVFVVFLAFNLVRAINTINELKIENRDLWAMLDGNYITTEEENF